MSSTTITIIPAQAGWGALDAERYEGSDDTFRPCDLTPVIAWRIETGSVNIGPRKGELFEITWPVVPDESLSESWMLVTPQGHVIDPNGRSYPSVEAAIADIRKAKE